MNPLRKSTTKSARRNVAMTLLAVLALTGLAIAAPAKPSLSVSGSPTSQVMYAGKQASVTYAVSVSRLNGFSGPVNVAVTYKPTWATTSFTSAQIPAGASSTTLTVTGTPQQTGAAPIQITASGTSTTGGGNVSANTWVSVDVQAQPTATTKDFAISTDPSTVTLYQGDSTTVKLSATRTNFTGDIALARSTVPAGTTVSFAQSPLTNASSSTTVTIATTASTPTGTHTIVISGTGTGVGTRYTGITVTVPVTGFKITGGLAPDKPLALGAAGQALDLTIENPFNQALTVSNVRARVASTGRAECPTSDFAVDHDATAPSQTIAPRSAAKVANAPKVRWVNDVKRAQNACLGASLKFEYTAEGRR